MPEPVYRFDDYILTNKGLAKGNEPISLGGLELQILLMLVEHHGQLVEKQNLKTKIWQLENVQDNTIDHQISSLRRHLGDDGSEQKYIRTHHRKGYTFIANVVVETIDPPIVPAPERTKEIVLLYKPNADPDSYVLNLVEAMLKQHGYDVFVDRRLSVGSQWIRDVEPRLRAADAVIALLSPSFINSEMLTLELQVAAEAAREHWGKPRLLYIKIQYGNDLPNELASILGPHSYATWDGKQDDKRVAQDLVESLLSPSKLSRKLVPVGGALPLNSRFYIIRPTDDKFLSAIERRDSIILIKGARQMGKTSLLARGLKQAREIGANVTLTDFQSLSTSDLNPWTPFIEQWRG
jgi:DNA-binding winged helix-turn-helix (wHTH) protein